VGDAVGGELFQIAADRHVRHTEQLSKVSDPDRTSPAQFGHDSGLALLGEHGVLSKLRASMFPQS
jgi:hypothetical protein